MSVGSRTEEDRQAERDERARHEIERGCGCGYWTAANPEWAHVCDVDGRRRTVSSGEPARLEWPHPKCSCEAAKKLREGAK